MTLNYVSNLESFFKVKAKNIYIFVASAFKICKLNDPSRNECIKEAIQYLLASPSNSESVGLPRLDPFTYDKATLNFDGSRLLNGTLTVKDIKVLGLRKEKVLSVKSAFNKGNMVVEAELFIPKVFGTGRYKADVSLNALKFNSRGQFNATLTEVNTKCVIKGKLNTINGVDYMKLYKFSILPDVKGMKISVSGLFPDENLSEFCV